MKICILGNSHIASLKHGLAVAKGSFDECEFTFFGARGNNLLGLGVEGTGLVAENETLAMNIAFTSGGLNKIELTDYDVCLLYGIRLILKPIDYRVSRSVKQAACLDNLKFTANYQTALKIRSISEIPIFMGHEPLYEYLMGELDATKVATYPEIYETTRAGITESGIQLLPQPEETVTSGWFTKSEYSSSAPRLHFGGREGEIHPVSDRAHMNGAFGSIYLTSFIRRLKSL